MRETVSFIMLYVKIYDSQTYFPKNYNMDNKKAKFYSVIVDKFKAFSFLHRFSRF